MGVEGFKKDLKQLVEEHGRLAASRGFTVDHKNKQGFHVAPPRARYEHAVARLG